MSDWITFTTEISSDLRTVMEHQSRPKKKTQMFGEGLQDVELSHETELRKEMFSSLDRLIQEWALRFQQIHIVAEKYAFFTSLSLLSDQYECQIHDDHDDIDKEEFLAERKRFRHFVTLAAAEGGTKTWKEGPLELLQFIAK